MTQDTPRPEASADQTMAAAAPDEAAAAPAQDVPPAAETGPDERIQALEAEVARLRADYLRALADAENAKRMADKRIEDNSKYAVTNFAKEILGVADNLSRALLAAPEAARAASDVVRTLAVGVEMTEKELHSALARYGVRKVEALDAAFDPHFHQAVQEVERTDVATGTVVQVYQDGWVIQDRLLRPAMVVVAKGGPKRAPSAPEAAPAADGPINRSV